MTHSFAFTGDTTPYRAMGKGREDSLIESINNVLFIFRLKSDKLVIQVPILLHQFLLSKAGLKISLLLHLIR